MSEKPTFDDAVKLLNFAAITLQGLRDVSPEIFGKADENCIDDIESFLKECAKEKQESDPCKPTQSQILKGNIL